MRRYLMTIILILSLIGLFPIISKAQNSSQSIHGYFDTVMGKNRYNSETWGFDAYHFTTIYNYERGLFRIYADVTYEHGTNHASINQGDLKVRAMLTWTISNNINLNIGKFLTPFGKYNLIHDASPVYISVQSPRSIYWKRTLGKDENGNNVKGRLYSKEATGIWAWGNFDIADWETEYDLYVVNGRGKGNFFKGDDNNDKGVGAKITFSSPFGLKFGGSFYTEKNGMLISSPRINNFLFEAEYEIDNFLIGGEILKSEIGSNLSALAWYGQIQYSIAEKYTPFLRIEHYDDSLGLNVEEDIIRFGLNIRLNAIAVLKAEYAAYKNGLKDVFQSQIAIAF